MQSSSKAQSSRQKMMPHYTECLEKKQKLLFLIQVIGAEKWGFAGNCRISL
ncbi:hypothetical protein A51_022155 [Vibrio cholerae MZO-3]|nr:hypothetical protein VCLMA_B0346 [Vibrio cholerae LMA3984-4]KNA49154.1 hypothetical protein A51_022155 [Vibrio cholerae MZO-3]